MSTPRLTDFPRARELALELVAELLKIPRRHSEKPEWFIMEEIEALSDRMNDPKERIALFDYIYAGLRDYKLAWPNLFTLPRPIPGERPWLKGGRPDSDGWRPE